MALYYDEGYQGYAYDAREVFRVTLRPTADEIESKEADRRALAWADCFEGHSTLNIRTKIGKELRRKAAWRARYGLPTAFACSFILA